MLVDTINGMFEFIVGLLVLNNCRILYNDKVVRGVSVFTTFIMSLWGYWNLFYYPSLNQWVSFVGGILIVLANTLWVILALHYRKKFDK